MAPISSANPPKRANIPGLLDDNIMVLIYTPDYFESDNVTIADFADDFVTLNRLHGMIVSRSDIEFYWSYGVRGAFKHDDPRQQFLLGQVKFPLFEEYLASLDGDRNGQAFKKELGNKGTRKEQTSRFQPDTGVASIKREAFENMDDDMGYPGEGPEEPDALQTETTATKTKKKKRRRKCRKYQISMRDSGEAAEQADAVSDPKGFALHTENDKLENAMLASQTDSPRSSPAELIEEMDGFEVSDVDERPGNRSWGVQHYLGELKRR